MPGKSIFAAAVLLGLSATSALAAPTEYFWNDPAGGAYSDSTKWTPAGPPPGADDAVFNNGSSAGYDVAISTSTNARALKVRTDTVTLKSGTNIYELIDPAAPAVPPANLIVGENSGDVGSLTLQESTVKVQGVSVGQSAGATGTLTVDQGKLNSASAVAIGEFGTGTVNIKNGATFHSSLSTSVATTIGVNSGATGELNIDGLNSLFYSHAPVTIGNGTLNLTNQAGFQTTGSVTVSNQGTVNVDSSSHFNVPTLINYGMVTLDGGGNTKIQNQPGAFLQGDGGWGQIEMFAGSTVAPGTGTGTIGGGTALWHRGATLQIQMNSASGIMGSQVAGWDRLSISGALTLDSGPGSFLIDLSSLNFSQQPGNALNFDPLEPKSWIIATVGGGITGFDPAAFQIDASGFTNKLAPSGYFHIAKEYDRLYGNVLKLVYEVPEPSTLALGLLGLAVVGFVARRRRRYRHMLFGHDAR